MLQINERNRVYGEDIHLAIESKNKNYRDWLNDKIQYADLKEEKDFFAILLKSSGGRPKTQYEFTLDAAKEICLLERNEKAKQIRRWLIDLSNKAENLELITVKQAAFAVKVINCLKYVENQKEAYKVHQTKFLAENIDICNPKYIYSEFAKYRANIVGWDKNKVDEAIGKYLNEHSGYNRSKIDKTDMQTKLSVMDIGEAVRVACLDILYSKDTDEQLASRFSMLCKNLAKEMQIVSEKRNESNLFREKEALDSIKELRIENL
jgi:phage anti-repressor protein